MYSYSFPVLEGRRRLNSHPSDFIRCTWSEAHKWYVFTDTTDGDRTSTFAKLETLFNQLLSINSNVATKDRGQAISHGMIYDPLDDMNPDKKPPVIYSDINIKNGISHEDFLARKKAGEIMMSDYERCVVRVRSRPGLCTPSGGWDQDGYLSLWALVAAGLATTAVVNGGTHIVIDGVCVHSYLSETPYFYTRLEPWGRPYWVYNSMVTAEEVYAACQARSLEPESLVTNTLAKVNRSSVDVLTAFAELPKSVKSVIKGARLVLKIGKDFKKKQFSLSKAHERRKKLMDKQYRNSMFHLDRELRKSSLSYNRRYNLQRHKDRITVQYRDALKDTAIEFANEMANVWLNYRYNIMPNVYLAQDIYDARDKYGRQFVTAAGKLRKEESLPVGNHYLEVATTLRCVIKRRFSAESAKNGFSVISNDIFTTAWELVPLSFVFDWFVNIGDNLTAQTYNVSWEDEKSSLANKCEFDASLTDSNYIHCQIPPILDISGFYYKRDVIIPSNYCGLVWQPKVGLERQLDLLSLSWRPVRSELLKNKRNK